MIMERITLLSGFISQLETQWKTSGTNSISSIWSSLIAPTTRVWSLFSIQLKIKCGIGTAITLVIIKIIWRKREVASITLLHSKWSSSIQTIKFILHIVTRLHIVIAVTIWANYARLKIRKELDVLSWAEQLPEMTVIWL